MRQVPHPSALRLALPRNALTCMLSVRHEEQTQAQTCTVCPVLLLHLSQHSLLKCSFRTACLIHCLIQDPLQVLHYSEEKIGLSQQIYDYVDQKIRRLDKDLKNFEGDIARERSKLGLAVMPSFSCHELSCCASSKADVLTTGLRQMVHTSEGPLPSQFLPF